MKTSNYLIGFAALASLTLVGCSDNDFLGDGPGGTFGSTSKGQLAFRTSGNNKTTRADITGENAATKLNKKFTVYGWKYVDASSDAAAEGFEDVFQDYVVKWEGTASAGTSESNTSGWEYVGYQSEPVDATQTSYDQTIKYWDWSTTRYDFIAWSIAKGNGSIITRNEVAGNATKTEVKSEPGLTFNVPTAKDLGGIYASDKFTSRHDVPGSWASTNWTAEPYAGLANIEDHPDADNHRGKYSQLGTNVTANQDEGIVNLQFRNLAAKVRIGIYETIPGYKVSDVVFYKDNGSTPDVYKHTWSYSDSNGDYNADQSFATLYADAAIFARSGKVAIKYHDAYYHSGDTEKDNVAFTEIASEDKYAYFAFGKLTNDRGSETAIESNPIGETSSTASMSIGNDDDNLYTYVFPMEGNSNVLKLKVNYLLTSIDGSKENIRVTGANAVVPVEFAKWRGNYAYTYLFKISDNTNGYTNPSTSPAGLYPITFDACLVNTEDGLQETITTVNDKSITTYQNGSKVTENSEYTKADAADDTKTDRIYFTVEGAENSQALLALDNEGEGQNVWLYTAWAADPSIITEEAVANYKANNIVLTDVTSKLDLTETEAPNESGAKYSIKFTAGTVASFEPVAKYYVIKAQYKDGDNTYITYKVVKVKDGSDAKKYAITAPAPAAITNLGSATFTISNAPQAGSAQTDAETLMSGNVTGASGAFKVTNSASENVTDRFTIEEGPITEEPTLAANTYRITSKGVPAGTYTISMGGANASIVVNAPAWYESNGTTGLTLSGATEPNIANVEEGHSVDVIIKDATGGKLMEGVVPTITAGTGAEGKLTASASNASGVITLTASKGASGTFTVAHNGASFDVNVDKYSITATRYIINKGDDQHKTATLTLANDGASSVTGRTLTSSNATVAANATGTDPTASIVALAAGTTTYSYKNATCDIEVVDYVLSQAKDRDGKLTVQLKQKKAGDAAYSAVSGATTIVADECTIKLTSTPGVYKVEGGTAGTIVKFKYKNVVVADVTLEAAGTVAADPAL